MKQNLIELIQANIEQLIQSENFKQAVGAGGIIQDDVIVVNNSTLLRELSKTAKSHKYLGLKIQNPNPLSFQANVIHFPENRYKNVNFDVLSSKDSRLASSKIEPLSVAVEDELDNLGQLLFILIGSLDQSKSFEVPISHSHYHKLVFNPSQAKSLEISGSDISIKDTLDADFILNELQSEATRSGNQGFFEDIKQPLENAVNELRKEAYISLILPQSEKDFNNCFLDRFVEFYRHELESYQIALTSLSNDKISDSAMNEILRIAYTFDEEINRMLKLLFNICDLKPIVFWATINSQFALLAAFDELSTDQSKSKLSLSDYSRMIHGARNHAFHGVLDFNQDIEAILDGINIKAHRLRIFSEHKSKGNLFDYEDREIVDALTAFTRPGEKYVRSDFWLNNYNVLVAFTDLVDSVSAALKCLFTTQEKQSI